MRTRGLDPFEFVAALLLVSLLSVLACAALGATSRSAHAEWVRIGLDGLFAQASRHAATDGIAVVLCPVNGFYLCESDGDWSRGWIGFADRNGDRQYNEGDDLLRRDLPLPEGVRLRALAGPSQIRFEPRAGRVAGGGFVLCDPRRPDEAIALTFTKQGRLQPRAASAAAARRCARE